MRFSPSAIAASPIGRHVLIYSVGASVVQLVGAARSILERANLVTAPPCPTCSVAQLPVEPPAREEPGPFAGDEADDVEQQNEATPAE